MNTHFLPAFRSSAEELVAQSDVVGPVVSELLDAVGGMLAILNEHRQVLAVNAGLLRHLGLDDPFPVFGLRPGEVLGCIHAGDEPGGCGTTRFCPTCGAAIAMAAALARERVVERTCSMAVSGGEEDDLFLRVRCTPLVRDGLRFLVLFVQDISREQKLSLLERSFFHDVNGLMTGILGGAELLCDRVGEEGRPLAESMRRMAERLANEVLLQAKMGGGAESGSIPSFAKTGVRQLFQDIEDVFHQSPLREGRSLVFADVAPETELRTDAGIVARVVKNMVTNALEASESGEAVRIGYRRDGGRHVFSVWNRAAIPPDTALRVFQRNFSTKAKMGRGMGTWSMKFFGEQILRGEVAFRSSEEDGTTFTLSLAD